MIPNFIIIGSAKCGTTSLAAILSEHPECCMSRPKEVSYFQDTIDHKPNPNCDKGKDWYLLAFSHYKGEKIAGEATPSYSDRSRSPGTAKRIFDYNPDMKIIYMVREPLARQASAWKMQYRIGKQYACPPVEAQWALQGFEHWMLKQFSIQQWDECRYHFQIQAYQEYFLESQILISFLEDWKNDMESEISRIFRFLNIDENFIYSPESTSKNVASNLGFPRWKMINAIKSLGLDKLKLVIPARYRRKAVHRLTHSTVKYPSMNLKGSTREQFASYVDKDCVRFLRHYGKPEDFWKVTNEE